MAKRHCLWIIAITLMSLSYASFGSAPESAATSRKSLSVASLGAMMVLESGRKKPLDTYARNKLLQFSGRQKVSGLSALEWLASVMFDPAAAAHDSIFLINNPDFVNALGISPRPGRRYSYAELYDAQSKLDEQYQSTQKTSPKEWSSFEKEIVRIQGNFIEYGSLSSTFSFIYPQDSFIIEDSSLAVYLDLPVRRKLSYFDLLMRSGKLSERMLMIKNNARTELTPTDRALVNLVKDMYEFASSVGNPPPHCIIMHGDDGETWRSPWGFIVKRQSAVLIDKPMASLLKMRDAYLKQDQGDFTTAVKEFNTAIKNSSSPGVRLPNPLPELTYNAIGPFSKAKILLGLSALLALIAVFSPARPIYWSSAALIAAGWLLVTSGIILRIIILRHPPLASLYETFVFVTWLTIIIGMVLERMHLSPVGLVTASVTGFIFLHLAGKFAGDEDTMGTLIAVLDSSFWLTTHIITISLGYAGCVGAGVLGHVYLIQKRVKKTGHSKIQALEGAVYGILCFGLLFTVIGTVFGGMWADQAWGSFWGWDPKENGALLIILWCLAVLHARSAGMIQGAGTAVGAIIGAVLVMCTWIGVNALGVGLHSYGFTSASVNTLLTYIGAEIAFLTAIFIIYKLRKGDSAKKDD